MCGICGIIRKGDNKDIIKKMNDRIMHRGPDGEGYYIDGDIAFGHRRLSIIDLSTGDQPIYNEDDSVVTVYNGEIYNYVELRSELESLGHEFKTKSDTEVLVHGYEEWHTDLPKHLRGMFAFAIHDKNRNEIFLARDNFGIKPLYYAKMNDSFMFASEIKSFLDVPDFKKEFNEDILETYLEFSFVPTNETFFKGVYRLDAGSCLLFKDGEIKINKYFKLDFKEKNISYEDAVKDIKKGMISYRNDSYGNIHTVIGKSSFEDKKLLENLNYVISTINKAKPAAVKGVLIKTITVSSTMGPGIRVDKNSFDI